MKPIRWTMILLLVQVTTSCIVFQKPLTPHQRWHERVSALRDDSGRPLLTDWEMGRLWEAGADYSFIREMAALRDSTGKLLMQPRDMAWFRIMGGTPEYARKMAELRDSRGKSLLSGYDIAEFQSMKAPFEYINQLAGLRKADGHDFFSLKQLKYFADGEGRLYFARSLASLQDDGKQTRFTAAQIVRLYKAGVFFGVVETLAGMRSASGLLLFTAESLVRYCEAGGTVIDAELLAVSGFDGKSIQRFRQLGLSPNQVMSFTDTEKPNAVVLLPMEDYNDEFESDGFDHLIKLIAPHYDMVLRCVATEDSIASLLGRIPDCRLLWIAGHGDVLSIQLGSTYPGVETIEFMEKAFVDVSDTELEAALALLDPDATIFLDACETDRWGNTVYSVAESVRKWAGNRRVIAMPRPFTHRELRLTSAYPLELTLDPIGE